MSNFDNNYSEDNNSFSLFKIIATVFSIIFIRIFIENFSSPNGTGYFFSWQGILLHASMYFFSVFLSLSILTYLFTKETFANIFTYLVKIFPFILAAPLIDLAFNGSTVSSMRYITTNTDDIVPLFFKIMNPFSSNGITIGMHISAYLIFLFLALFIYKKTQDTKRSIFFLLSSYFTLFLYAILPGILLFLQPSYGKNLPSELAYALVLKQSWITTTIENAADFKNILWQGDYMHDISMARLFWILILLQSAIIFFLSQRKLWNSLKNNLRMERVIFWILVAAIGIFMNQKMFGHLNLSNGANIIALLVLFLLITLNAWLAVFINDAEDIDIDMISNKDRPLANKEISNERWSEIQMILVLFIIFGTATINKASAFLLILAQAVYYIYSARPLRLKRHFIYSSLLIGAAAVFIAMAGFFLVSPDQHITTFPAKAILLIGVSFAIISNKKDIKDYEGDKKENMITMPVFFGPRKANYIIATLYGLVVFLVPIFLKNYSLIPFSACVAFFAFFLFTKKTYEEKYIFALFFIYMSVMLILNS